MSRILAALLMAALVGCGSDKPSEPIKVRRHFLDRGGPDRTTTRR